MIANPFFRILAEERVIVLAVVTLTVISAVVAGQIIPPEIKAVAQVEVLESGRSTQLLGLTTDAKEVDHDVLMDTHVRLATSPAIARRVIERLGLADTPEQLLKRMTVSAVGRANVLTFEATADSAERSAKLADTWVAEYMAWSNERARTELEAASASLEPRLSTAESRLVDIQGRLKTQGHTKELDTALSAAAADYEQLLKSADHIQLLTSIAAPPVSVISKALAEERSLGMSMVVDAVKGFIAGLVLGVLIGFLKHRLAPAVQPG